MPRTAHETDVVRVAAVMRRTSDADAVAAARKIVLAWAETRVGSLPGEARQGQSFESLIGGRNCVGVRIVNDDADIWAVRVEDPDKSVPGRTWTTEVTIGVRAELPALVGIRLIVSAPPDTPEFDPATQSFVADLIGACGLEVNGVPLRADALDVDDIQAAEDVLDLLLDSHRTIPVVIASTPDGTEQPLIDCHYLARVMAGLAHVVVVRPPVSWALTQRFDKRRSVYGGAVRVYMPGFSEDADPYAHRLELADRLRTGVGAASCMRWIRRLCASHSVRANTLGRGVMSFSAIRSAASRAERARLAEVGASDADQLAAARDNIATLEGQLHEAQALIAYFEQEGEAAESRAREAEAQLRALRIRVQDLSERLAARAGPTPIVALPSSWPELLDWSETALAGKLVFSPRARRNLRSPAFNDPLLAARCLSWLAEECRGARLAGTRQSLQQRIEDAIHNCPCGGDAYSTQWEGRSHEVDWHVKNGGNTRDPARCLRIYHFWDPDSRLVVVDDLPAHRITGAS